MYLRKVKAKEKNIKNWLKPGIWSKKLSSLIKSLISLVLHWCSFSYIIRNLKKKFLNYFESGDIST